ncbi:P-selectin-like isoform X2 [Argiope bruennichi]|uniref:P-selectin-like isoform X2 n=1 Tax=Argiope bruennichi TaxID=94029 RepID=UPI0024940B79|nr:P-selectin-like isoform X2 [Argiope bruennichi]
MLIAGIRFDLVLVSILVGNVYSSCLFYKTCPCGTTGKNYTRCNKAVIPQYSCERWANCQTCKDNYEFCLTCPPGHFGPTCRDGPCPLLKRPKYGSIKCVFIGTFRSSCTARCMAGYQFENEPTTEEITLKCHQNSWTPRQEFPECKSAGRQCTLKITGNSSYNCTTDMERTYCDITCNDKFHGRYYCLPGRGWNSTLPVCAAPRVKKEKAICPDPGTPKDGGRVDLKGNPIPTQHIFKEGDVILYFCNEKNTDFQPSTYLTCRSDTTWDGILPQCGPSHKKEAAVQTESSCKHPGVVENGIIEDFASETEQFSEGTELRFLCREGYEIQGPNVIYCLRNFSWSEAPPICKQIDAIAASISPENLSCKHPGIVKNGFIVEDVSEMQSFPVGSVLRFQCKEGYEMVGVDVIHCLHSVDQRGYWSDLLPFCRYIPTTTTMKTAAKFSCTHPGIVENGFTEDYPLGTQSFPVGTALKFQCREGYEIEGPKHLYCIRNGEWSESPPRCKVMPTTPAPEVTCEHPGMVKNGRFEGDTSMTNFPVGTPLTINCTAGTQREGPKTIYCLYTGKWSEAPPTCKFIRVPTRQVPQRASQVLCKHPGAIENGVNKYSAEVYMVGSEIKFECKEGYTIEGSDTLYCQDNGQWTSAPPICIPQEKIPDCGRVFQEVYAMTGKYTRSDWPWTVGISTVDVDDVEKMFCGGALLNSKTVLTAAHCVTSAQNIKLHFGHHQQVGPGAPVSEQVRNVSRRIIHPEYDDETHANDIALMKFDHHIYYDPRTQPICLPTPILNSSGKSVLPGTIAIATGYGLEFAANHPSVAKFKMLELLVQSEKKCGNICRDQGLVSCSPSTFCASSMKDILECIYGGSPLVVYHPEKSRYTLEGLVTRAQSARNQWNGRCKRAERYTTFTNVTTFMPFILENLN